MDQLFSQLKPTLRVGNDGFNWWMGQIEGTARDDINNKGGYRFKVRIIGDHPKDSEIVSTADLPWANVMMPVNVPFLPGNTGGAHPQLQIGCFVVGFYLDNERQKPIIMGSVGHTPRATTVVNFERPDEIDSLTRKIPADLMFAGTEGAVGLVENKEGGVQSDYSANSYGSGLSDGKKLKVNPILDAVPVPKNLSNTARLEWCQSSANPCTDLKTKGALVLSEFLAEIQNNDGKIGTYYVGKVTGKLYDGLYVAKKYTNKFMALVRTLIANVKGFINGQVTLAGEALINATLRPTKKGNALSNIMKWINKILANIGCKMADIGERIAKWLTNLLMSYIDKIYRAVACQIDELIGGILSKIMSLMESLLQDILGPLQDILGAIAVPLNIIGGAINYVLKLLGIQCSGSDLNCKDYDKYCTNGEQSVITADDEEELDSLDELLAQIEKTFDGTTADYNQYICEDAFKGKPLLLNTVGFTGGVPKPTDETIIYDIDNIEVTEGEEAIFTITREGVTDIASSLTFKTLKKGTATADVDYVVRDGIVGFAPNETSKQLIIETIFNPEKETDEYFYVKLDLNSPDKSSGYGTKYVKNIGRCTIKEQDIQQPVNPYIPPSDDPLGPVDDEFPDSVVDPVPGDGEDNDPNGQIGITDVWKVTSDRTTVKEGEFIIYTITTTNVANGTAAYYNLSGNGITGDDILGGQLTGEFVVNNNKANITIGIEEDGAKEDDETLTLTIHSKGASCDVLIEAPTDQTVDDFDLGEGDTPETDPGLGIVPPIVDPAEVITDENGSIIDIPIKNPGTPWESPPFVVVKGEGIGANAFGLLDGDGYLTEIRVISGGYGYKKNLASGNGKRCIIDTFTVLRPGIGYIEKPEVYVNGVKGIAEAVINEDGFVIGARVLDRAVTFTETPEVRVIGKYGNGAQLIPSMICLGTQALADVGATKIGTGRYVDCP